MGKETEYKEKCDNCSKTGSGTFARIFYKLIEGKWKYLCARCWEIYK